MYFFQKIIIENSAIGKSLDYKNHEFSYNAAGKKDLFFQLYLIFMTRNMENSAIRNLLDYKNHEFSYNAAGKKDLFFQLYLIFMTRNIFAGSGFLAGSGKYVPSSRHISSYQMLWKQEKPFGPKYCLQFVVNSEN